MKNLDNYLDIANSIECDEVPDCDTAFGNNINAPIMEGIGDFARAANNLYKIGHKSITEGSFIRGSEQMADLTGVSNEELAKMRDMSREEILAKYGNKSNAIVDKYDDSVESYDSDNDGIVRVSDPDIDTNNMSADEVAQVMGKHTDQKQETHRLNDLEKRMTKPPKPSTGNSDFTKSSLSQSASKELSDLVIAMGRDDVQNTFNELPMDTSHKDNYWYNEIENYADVLVSDENRDAVVTELKKELDLSNNDFNSLLKLHDFDGE